MFEKPAFPPRMEPFPPACGKERPHAPHSFERQVPTATSTGAPTVAVLSSCEGLRAHPNTMIGNRA